MIFPAAVITVAKVQVAVFCRNRAPYSLLGTMARLADEADTDEVGLDILYIVFNLYSFAKSHLDCRTAVHF